MDDNQNQLIPVLSDGLEFSKLTDKEYILSNTAYKHYLKINSEVYDLISFIDGKADLESISTKISNKLDKNISPEYVYELVYGNLIRYGVLKGYDDFVKPYQKPQYLNLSFIILNERLLSKFVKFFYFLFDRKVAVLMTLFSITSIFSLLIMNIDLYQSFNLQASLVYFFVVMALSVTFHEIGHAASASFFGAKHGGIGGGFYLFTPVYFADVTDIWRLSKIQRVIVNVSGMYFELIFCSLLAIAGFIFGQQLLMIMSIFVCLHTFFNLNPFLRSDGFWVLTDLTNKPNLFFHSAEKVKDLFRMIQGKRIKWTMTDFLLFLYGSTSFLFIGLFLYYVLFQQTNSIIFFPKNLFVFVKNIFTPGSEISLIKLGELLVPMVFFVMLISLIKPFVKRMWEKLSLNLSRTLKVF